MSTLNQKPPAFNLKPCDVIENMRILTSRLYQVQEQVINTVGTESANFENVLLPLAWVENAISAQRSVLTVYRDVSPHKDVRNASSTAVEAFDNFSAEMSMNDRFFELVEAVFQKREPLDSESQRFLETKHRTHVRNGLLLKDEIQRQHFRDIKQRIGQLKTECLQNLGTVGGEISLSYRELEGVPNHVLSTLHTDVIAPDRRHKLQLREEGTLSQVLMYAANSETRKLVYETNENRFRRNELLLREIFMLRDEAARIIGYSNHATMRLEEKIAKKPETVDTLLAHVASQLHNTAHEEIKALKRLKKIDVESRGELYDDQYFFWDHAYYNRIMLEREYLCDKQLIAEYFPLSSTVQNMLEMLQKFFGLVFSEILDSDTYNDGDSKMFKWHDDVRLFSVSNDETEGGNFIGYLYLDLFSRKGKSGNAFNTTVIPGCTLEDGTRQFPSTAVLCSFPKPTSADPSFLQHRDIVLLLHELGHDGTASLVDFAEAPSQMLENWCWQPLQIKRLASRHYSYVSTEHLLAWNKSANGNSRPSEHISDQAIAGLVRSKHVNSALLYLRQISIAMFDLEVHKLNGRTDLDLAVQWTQVRSSILPIAGGEAILGQENWAWSHSYASFSHFVNNYDAGYYSYMFSLAYSADIFRTAFQAEPENSQEGRRYRHSILEKGASENEMDILTEFLGRPPNDKAFAIELGIIS